MSCEVPCSICPAQQESLLGVLGAQDISLIEQHKVTIPTTPKEILFFEGDPSEGLYCISKGRIKLYKTNKQGHRKIIHIAGPGEIIGYRSILADDMYQATAECLDEGEVCLIQKDTFKQALSGNNDLALTMLAHLAKNLGQSQSNELNLAHDHIDQRFAQLLLYLQKRYGTSTEQGILIDLPLSRQDIADFIGSTQESAIRIVTTFKKLGILATHKKQMVIEDPEKLASLINETL